MLLIINEVTLLAFFARADGAESVLPRLFVYGKRIARRRYNQVLRLTSVTGGELGNGIPAEVEHAFYRTFLQHVNEPGFNLTEAYWKEKYKVACGFSSDAMLRDMLNKSELEGVTRRQNPTAKNSPRVLASMRLLRKKASPTP